MVGCSTGEEAYSLAIVFREAIEKLEPASDSLCRCLRQTSIGTPLTAPGRASIRRTFRRRITRAPEPLLSEEQGKYRVNKQIREMLIFAPQNVIKDPPFTKLDIVTCRNLLIYMEHGPAEDGLAARSLQPEPRRAYCFWAVQRALAAFPSFSHHLIQNRGFSSALEPQLPLEPIVLPHGLSHSGPGQTRRQVGGDAPVNIQSMADQLLLQSYTPAAVLVTNKGDIIYISGRTGQYLEPAAGKANWNIFVMAREGLRYELMARSKKRFVKKRRLSSKTWL